jgi:DNA-binding NtrC family response regulator
MPSNGKKILIIDEESFSRVCSAILEFDGFKTESIKNFSNNASLWNNNEFGLVITSYPYGEYFVDEIKRRDIPTIILSDQINRDIMNILECFNNSYCMIKPLDYQKFKSLVKQIMHGDRAVQGGYNIL